MAAEEGAAAAGREPPAATPPHFAILLAAGLAVAMAYGVTLPVLPFQIERALGADAAAISWHTGALTGLYTLALFICSYFWGSFSDRAGRQPVIAIGLAGSSVGLLMLDAATTLPALYLARVVSGALSAAVLPAVLALVAETAEAPARAHRFALISSATTLGFLLGPIMGSWLSPMVLSPLAGMRIAGLLMPDSPFFLVAAIGLLVALALLVTPTSPKPFPSQDALLSDRLEGAPRHGRYLGLFLTGITVFGITIAEVGITLLGKQVLLLDAAGIARFFLVCGIVMIVVQVGIFPVCVQRMPLFILATLCLLAIVAGLALIAYATMPETVMLAFALVSFATAILIPALATLISAAAGPIQGKAMGQQAAAANLGQALAASMAGALFLIGPGIPFLVGAAAVAIGVPGAFGLRRS